MRIIKTKLLNNRIDVLSNKMYDAIIARDWDNVAKLGAQKKYVAKRLRNIISKQER
jgi:hypothetical protein